MNRLKVVGIGHEGAGDDGIGPAVMRALAERGVPPEVDLHAMSDPTGLIELLGDQAPVLLIDAVVGTEPGLVIDLKLAEVESGNLMPLSTHGMGVMEAIALAQLLRPDTAPLDVHVVGVGIRAPGQPCLSLSPSVAAALPVAVERAVAWIAHTRSRIAPTCGQRPLRTRSAKANKRNPRVERTT